MHGLFGNPDEVGALQDSLRDRSGDEDLILVHSAGYNHEKTTDGIVAGGKRLAQEVNEWLDDVRKLKTQNQKISLSFVGNSLGGLYSRYSLALIDWTDITPAVFCTTVTPHLGVSSPHTYLPIGSALEYAAAQVLRQTGMDLFRRTSVLQDMTVNSIFVEPLARFRRRIAVGNAYYTDFQVPCSSAVFLSKEESVPHSRIEYQNVKQSLTTSNVSIVMAVETDRQDLDILPYEGEELKSDDLAKRLDVLGWTKIFCDVRSSLPTFSLPFKASSSSLGEKDDKSVYSSSELWNRYASIQTDRMSLPFGHSMLIANSKDEVNARLNAPGKPIMDRLADDMVNDFRKLFLEN